MSIGKAPAMACLGIAVALAGPAAAVPVYNESSGDFSNNRAAPTLVTFAPGQNDITGQTGSTAGVTDRDYFTFVVPFGFGLVSLTVLNSSLTAGNATFLGLQAGAQVTVDPANADASLLLGYELVSPADIGNDILPSMQTAAGAAGFEVPLGAGQYSVWVQDSNVAPSVYALGFQINFVPEPGTALLTLLGLAGIGCFVRRSRAAATA